MVWKAVDLARLGAGLVPGLSLALACGGDPYACVSNGQCVGPDGRGWCEQNGYCSFPDPDCDSGRRFGELASDLANACVPLDAGAADDGSTTTGSLPTTSSAGTSSADDLSTSDNPMDDGPDADGETTAKPGETSDASAEEGTSYDPLDSGDSADSIDPGESGMDPEGEGSAGGEVEDSGTPAGCEDVYGSLPNFILCGESEQVCSFYVESGGASCDDLCGAFGGTCLEAVPDRVNDCEPDPEQAPLACSDGSSDQICTCTVF